MKRTLYTNSTVTLPAEGAAAFVWQMPGEAPLTVQAVEGRFTFATGATPGVLYYQTLDSSGAVIGEGELEVKQDLAHAGKYFDHRSLAKRTLEALEAKIAGRALTIQQTKIQVGDRSIEYMNSIDELLRWRDHFAQVVAKEEGRGGFPKLEKLCFKRN